MDVPVIRFAIALLIGALIGIEREKSQRAAGEESATGLRTFILIAEAGALAAWLSLQTGQAWIFAGIGVASALFVLGGYVSHVRRSPGSIGLTTEFAALVAYLLGGTVVFGAPELAVALAIATSAVLAFRQTLHAVVERIGWDDIFAALKLLIVIFIVLPVVPRHAVDPWGALNPYAMTWMVILIAGLSLAGYVAARLMGPGRGAAVTGLVGGLASSTAVTLAMSRRSRERGETHLAGSLAAGVLLSWAVMFVRVVVASTVVNPAVGRALTIPMGVMALIAALGALASRRGNSSPAAGQGVPLKNPFSLSFAVKFALFFAAITLLVDRAQAWLPGAGAYIVAAIAGFTDVDAITLSMAQRATPGDTTMAVTAIAIAVLSNTLVKTGFVMVIASPAMRRVVLPTALLIAAGAAVALVLLR
jgi:uncharacterized membrane protein (DUF4010 family)